MTDQTKDKLDWFADKEYRDMDWLGKAVEPYVFPLIDEINKIPETTEITLEDLFQMTDNLNKRDLSLESIVKYLIAHKWPQSINAKILIDGDVRMSELFEIKFPSDMQINLHTKAVNGSIIFKKRSTVVDDEIIKEMAAKLVSDIIYYNFPSRSDIDLSRANEIIDLLDSSNSERKSRSGYRKRDAIRNMLQVIVKEDKWRVRNVELLKKAARWACSYVRDGNLAAIANLTKLKCMTHKREPIYSMEEIV